MLIKKAARVSCVFLAAVTPLAIAQEVVVTTVKGDDGCPELRAQNNGRRAVDVTVEYNIQQRADNNRMRGGTKQDVLDDIPPGGRARTFGTYTFGVNCERAFDFQHKVLQVKSR